MYRKGRHFNLQSLVDNLDFIDVKDLMLNGRIPKISFPIEQSILRKLFEYPKVSTYIDYTGSPIYYRTTGGRYFKVVTNYSTGSTKEKSPPLRFKNKYADAIGCILSSNLSFWFYQIYSNNLDWKSYEIDEFRIPELTDNNIADLQHLYSEYLEDIESHAKIRKSTGESKYNVSSFKEYKIGRSKAIINKIDDLICPFYGLTKEEINFIKSYDLEFRQSDEE